MREFNQIFRNNVRRVEFSFIKIKLVVLPLHQINELVEV